jgi:hypothetical protein
LTARVRRRRRERRCKQDCFPSPETEFTVVVDVPANSQLSNAVEPLVSFIIPAYNEATPLPETLGRIRDLNTEIPYETIVVDGGSEDDTRFLAAAYGAIVIDQEGSGIGAARHQGTERAHGEWYAFVDADTEVDPSYLDAMLGFVREEGLVAATSRCALRGPRRAAAPQFIHNHLFPRSDRPVLPGFNTFVHREAYAAAGGYRNLPNEDKVLSRRLAAVGETGYHPDVLVEPSGRRVAEQGLFGMTWHYLDLNIRAIADEDAGDRFRPIALAAVLLTLLAGVAQGYHGFGLGHLTAVLGAIGFFGGALLFVMDISRQRIFGYGAAVVAVQIAIWVLQGANHGSFGLALYGLETVLAGLLLGNYLLYRTDRFRSPIERTGEPIEGSRESIERTREIE